MILPPRCHRPPAPVRGAPVLMGVQTGALLAVLLPLLLAAWASTAPAHAAASAWRENPQSRVRLITPYDVAPREGELRLGVHFTLEPGWHVYWKNSGDAGFPPAIDASETPGLDEAELLYPAPERFELPGDLVAYGYADEVVYPVRVRRAERRSTDGGEPAPETVELRVTLDYLVCEVDCIPYGYTFRLEQPLGAEAVADPETAPLLERWSDRVPRPVTELPGARTEGEIDWSDPERPVLRVLVEGVEPLEGVRPQIFLEHHELFGVPFRPGGPEVAVDGDALRFRVPLEPRRRVETPPESSSFAWTVTGLRDIQAAEARRAVPVVARAGDRGDEGSGSAEDRAGAGAPRTPSSRRGPGLLAGTLGALVGGVLLALTPGALALLLAFLPAVRATAARSPVLPLGLAACGGSVGASLVLALFARSLESGAPAVQLAEPTTATALALVALSVALWLWGVVGEAAERLTPARLGTGPATAAGALVPLLALPWAVAPLSGIIGRATAAGPWTLTVTAALLGLGLGLPWIAGAWLAGRTAPRRPEHGDAADTAPVLSERLREGLGFLALLSVVWLLYLLSDDLRTESLAFVELSLLAVALLAWLRRKAGRAQRTGLETTLTVLLLAAAVATVWLADAGRLRARQTWDNRRASHMNQEVIPWQETTTRCAIRSTAPSARWAPPSRS